MDKKIIFSVDDLTDGEVSRLFFTSRTISALKKTKAEQYANALVLTAFFEPSTRTRLSFEIAALRLGMKVSNFHPFSSSLSKGESIDETLRSLLALAPDILVVRQQEPLRKDLFSLANVSIISGGDGVNEHPTQALLDCFTLVNHFRSDDLFAKNILIIGDVAHSRVAHSNIKLMSRLGANVSVLAPKPFQITENLGQKQSLLSFSECSGEYDVVMCLRMQKERMIDGCLMSDTDYFYNYGLTLTRLFKMGPQCMVLHPGPMNVGVEIDLAVFNHPQSLIQKQVENGVLVRSALLDLCL